MNLIKSIGVGLLSTVAALLIMLVVGVSYVLPHISDLEPEQLRL
ncbi:MAG: hypothetical protein ACLPND_13065 [Candidatus Korobacteraceae bacterium]